MGHESGNDDYQRDGNINLVMVLIRAIDYVHIACIAEQVIRGQNVHGTTM